MLTRHFKSLSDTITYFTDYTVQTYPLLPTALCTILSCTMVVAPPSLAFTNPAIPPSLPITFAWTQRLPAPDPFLSLPIAKGETIIRSFSCSRPLFFLHRSNLNGWWWCCTFGILYILCTEYWLDCTDCICPLPDLQFYSTVQYSCSVNVELEILVGWLVIAFIYI